MIERDDLDDVVTGFESGEARLWAAVIVQAWRERRWMYFLDPGSTFPLAAACCNLDAGLVRARVRGRKKS